MTDKPIPMIDKPCPNSPNIIDTTLSVVCGTNGCFTQADKTKAVPGKEPCDCPTIAEPSGDNHYYDNGVEGGLRYCKPKLVFCDERDCGVNVKRTPVGNPILGLPDYTSCPSGYFHNDIQYRKGYPYKTCLLNSLGPDGLKCGKNDLCIEWPDPEVGTYLPNCSFWHKDLASCPTGYTETGFEDGWVCDFRMCRRTA